MIKRQKRPTASLQPSLIKSPVYSSGTGLNIKILTLQTKFRTRSFRITNSRSHKHSFIGSRREAVVCQWRHFAINRLTRLWFIPSCLAKASLCLACLLNTDYVPTVLILHGMMHHDVFLQTWDFWTWGYPKTSMSHIQYISFQPISILLFITGV